MHTEKDNDKDLRQVMRCDAELNCTAAPQLAKTVAEELNLDDKDIDALLKSLGNDDVKETPSAIQQHKL